MEIAMVAIKPLIVKLSDLLVGELTLENRVRKDIESLSIELTLMHAALRKVAKVPHEQLDDGVKIWAGNVKELSYHMEDIIDAFIVRVEEGGEPANPDNRIKKFLNKTVQLFKNGKDLHRISDALEDAVGQAKQLAKLRRRYEQKIWDIGVGSSIDPRMVALYTDVTELVGIEETRDELINMLSKGDGSSKHPPKTVSIVGFGGLGKTTLAKTTYEKIKVQFDCGAFVSVSQNPDMKKVFKNILYELDKDKYVDIHNATREENHLIDEIIEFLRDKRYLIVIDDLWDEKAWQLIKCAFPHKGRNSRLITTTRIGSVSKACCSSSDDIYVMKPLSKDVSKRLFHKRVFSHEKGCPHELVQVSEDILQKCGGVPLAIITIASILASNHQIKSKDKWHSLLNTIGHGLTEDHTVDAMKRILLFSYYDLPSYLKPCFLYLSIFPEDHMIIREKLIWRWISEGFVYSEKQETSLYELGDSYFNELVNRSMIQPVGIDDEEKAEGCRVHDMVLDLIRSLSSEENFVTVLNDTQRKVPISQSNVRRLSIQNSNVDVDLNAIAQVRSLILTNNIVDQPLNISTFQVLRVLVFEGCNVSDIGYVGSLLHLRYLGLSYTNVKELPMEIGKLQFLQTLDLSNTRIKKLPPSIVRLRRLMCLCIPRNANLPSGICNMTSLEVLEGLRVGGFSRGYLNLHVVKELGHLIELRVLRFSWGYLRQSTREALVESLNNLQKLEILDIYADFGHVGLMREGWLPSLQLRRLEIYGVGSSFGTLPAWINPSVLPVLSYLSIRVKEALSEDVQLVGMLPALRYLELWGDEYFPRDLAEISVVTADAFPSVTECNFSRIAAVPSVFPRGAAPRLKHLSFSFPAMWITRGDFDLGMRHLPSLEEVDVILWRKKASDQVVYDAEAALRAAAKDHPNCPDLRISTW